MKSSQINFYISPSEFSEIAEYLKNSDISILATPMPTINLMKSDSFSTTTAFNYLCHKNNESQIANKYIEKQNHYLLDVITSPIIEVIQPRYKNNKRQLKSGRLYYVKEYFDKNGNIEQKTTDFLELTDIFFKWFRKNIKQSKNVKISGFLVSEEVGKLVEKDELLLI